MHSSVLLGLVAFAAGTFAQLPAYAQCGGDPWTGQTTCVAGYYCFYSSQWYSQCVPGTGPVVSTTLKTSTTSKVSTSTAKSTSTTSKSATTTSKPTSSSVKPTSTVVGACTAAFTPISASAAYAGLNPGWNLGNTLDAVPDEGSWNNPPVVASTFTNIYAQGFKSVRIPVTWAYHFDTTSPSWTVNQTWMNRVETVVDEALATGFYVILNVHHDSWVWADPTVAGANITAINERFGRLWAQIGARFACKSSKLIFEALNEPVGTTQEHAAVLNNLSDIFLTQINLAGGYNPQRVVALSGLGQDSVKTIQWFSRSSLYPSQPWGLEFHYYSPYDFIFDAWGKTIWGSAADKAALQSDFANFYGNFSTIPTFIGEWDASATQVEEAGRWKYLDFLVRTANSFKFSTVLWDNGLDQYNRASNTWYDVVDRDIILNAQKGITNSLADSTTDPSATAQTSSAFLFHKVGTAVTAQTATYLLNGNTLKSIKNAAGTTLSATQYSVSGGVVTFSTTYLSTLFSATAAPGIKDTLTLTFSAGAQLTLTVVQYDTPVIPTTTYKVDPSADLHIPITWNGVKQVAAIKALNADGTYMVSGDSWTSVLGPLQQAHWTYGSWGFEDAGLIIYASGLSAIQAAGQTAILTIEFYPRALGTNSVNITFTQ